MQVKTTERNFMERKTSSKTSVLVKTAVLSAIAYIIMMFEFPLPFAPAFLKLDFSDIPPLIASFALGPWVGVAVELIKNVLKFITNTHTGGVGELGNFLVGASFVLTAGYVYRLKKGKKFAVIACLCATVAMTLVAVVFNNFILIPFYSKVMPIEAIIAMGSAVTPKIQDVFTLVLYGITPFNLFKGIVISGITMGIYKRIKPLLRTDRH